MSAPATSAQAARLPVCNAIQDRLETLGDRLTVYPGEIDGQPRTLPGQSGRVKPYAIVWGATGRPDTNANLAATTGGPERLGDLVLAGQITFAAGYRDDLLALLDDALPLLQLWTPSVPGLSCGRLRQQPGFDAGPPRRDENARPPRFFTPWLWTLHVTSSPA